MSKSGSSSISKSIASWVEQAALVMEIVGIDAITAYKLLAEFSDIEDYESANALVAHAGVTPAQYESGTSVRRRPRLSKVDKANVRAAMYWPVITAMRRCEAFAVISARAASSVMSKFRCAIRTLYAISLSSL